ncbi:hypothetical protein HYC85_000050, partial [Camellia sinensis]
LGSLLEIPTPKSYVSGAEWGRDKNASRKAPDVSAIFMSNRTTIEECFKIKLFGLPHAFLDFVKEVQAGMVLFLFEFEQRKLYDVFQAVTDGSMNIVPNVYRSIRKSFPAQIITLQQQSSTLVCLKIRFALIHISCRI